MPDTEFETEGKTKSDKERNDGELYEKGRKTDSHWSFLDTNLEGPAFDFVLVFKLSHQ